MAPGELLLLRGILLHCHRLDGGDQEEKAAVGCSPIELVLSAVRTLSQLEGPLLLPEGTVVLPSTVVCFYVMDTVNAPFDVR